METDAEVVSRALAFGPAARERAFALPGLDRKNLRSYLACRDLASSLVVRGPVLALLATAIFRALLVMVALDPQTMAFVPNQLSRRHPKKAVGR